MFRGFIIYLNNSFCVCIEMFKYEIMYIFFYIYVFEDLILYKKKFYFLDIIFLKKKFD